MRKTSIILTALFFLFFITCCSTFTSDWKIDSSTKINYELKKYDDGLAISYKTLQSNLIIPKEIAGYEIKALLFSDATNPQTLTQIVIPATIVFIDSFQNFTSITNIVIPGTLKKCPSFMGCSALLQIELEEGITEISSNAFNNCKKLASLTIPSTVTKIGTSAFENLDTEKTFKSLTVKAKNPPEIDAAEKINSIEKVFVPDESLESYKNDEIWNKANLFKISEHL